MHSADDPRERSLVRPEFFRPLLGRTARRAIMVFDQRHLERLRELLGLSGNGQGVATVRYYAPSRRGGVGLIGPALGAPLAAMAAEVLFACGTRELLVFGTCGSLQRFVKIGELIMPDSALSEEGTSRHYFPQRRVFPTSAAGCAALQRRLLDAGRSAHSGRVWTTDALFRETRSKVARMRADGLLAVEMELSALCAVAEFRGDCAVTPLLVVSDSLAGAHWRPGLLSPSLGSKLQRAMELLVDFACSAPPVAECDQ